MKILSLSLKSSGCGYHRVMLPTLLMPKEKGRITNTLTDGIWDECWDIVSINRTWDFDDLIELKKVYKFKLVVDVDDYWILDHHHLMYDGYNFGNFASRVIKHFKAADLVTVTHDRLADMVRPYNPNVVITPNAIPYGEGHFTTHKIQSDKVRFFWAGGITHEPDLRLLKQPLSVFDKDVQMILGGYSDSNYTEQEHWGKMLNYFTDNQRLDFKIIRGKEPFDYYTMFEEGDVMLIPLQKTMFNQYKSNLKILEAAGKKMPVIVSAVHPYLGFPEDVVNYVRKPSDWIKHMNNLMNEDVRNEQGERLFEYCKTHYNFKEINELRKQSYECLLEKC